MNTDKYGDLTEIPYRHEEHATGTGKKVTSKICLLELFSSILQKVEFVSDQFDTPEIFLNHMIKIQTAFSCLFIVKETER